MSTFGQRLHALRKKHNVTQVKLGKYLGTDHTVISNWENEKHGTDHETIRKIADYFGVSTPYLLGDTDDPTPITSEDKIVDLREQLNLFREAIKSGKKIPIDGGKNGYLTEKQINQIEKFIDNFVIEKHDA
jgi:transcriptional regulator with XRE-family HTH domain